MAKHGGDIYRNKVHIDFSVNTSPYGIPSAVKTAMNKSLLFTNTYPDPDYVELREAIAKMEQVNPDWIVCGNGASELFVAISRALKPKKASLIQPCFSEYEKALSIENACEINHILLEESEHFRFTEEKIKSVFNLGEDVFILGNPNNPTGELLSEDSITSLIQKAEEKNRILLLDESFLPLTEAIHTNSGSTANNASKTGTDSNQSLHTSGNMVTSDHLIRVRSFTKSMCLPGIRIGYAIISNDKLREQIKAQLPEWNVSVPAMYAGIAASYCQNWLSQKLLDKKDGLFIEREYLRTELEKQGIKTYPSDTNFILIKTEKNLYEALLAKGILIRKCDNFIGLNSHFYRIAVKSHQENEILIHALQGKEMKASSSELLHVLPEDIEKTSFEILTSELAAKGIFLEGETAPVIKRCIHTAADFEYAETLCFSDKAVSIAKALIRKGAHIVTDTNMALSGVNKKELEKYGGAAHCFMADPEIARLAKERGTTRASMSMEYAATLGVPIIFAIGNAPTALVTLCDLIDRKVFIPDFVIGVPVGFVNVEVAKEMIMERNLPYIVNRGRKGGSNVAAAICNAILYEMRKEST